MLEDFRANVLKAIYAKNADMHEAVIYLFIFEVFSGSFAPFFQLTLSEKAGKLITDACRCHDK